ncbi:uncharacterized protein F5Z01DRAFT_525010 [Emericellopsis atlantica]|uniref:Uncharacterized protein n=1 Tax=Emericellopsis atlantica TaxID=2614577 RepID=A0A9P7ZPK2_9HYPO|nr:uncharacterized protein F5Z01DRAFT_525010 [Emericellopsis atlantica]KAG9255923.1 hypothetical protein F5Z01DRAFT_525010 [Emericellopsis atlantica]
MAAVSFSTRHEHGGAKITKSRTRNSVKPMLRKLHSSSYSEKNSLDLDRGWDEQLSPHLGYVAPTLDDYYYSSSSTATPTPASQKANPDDLLNSHPYYQQQYAGAVNFASSLSPADLSLSPTNGTIHSMAISSPAATPALTASSASTTIDSPSNNHSSSKTATTTASSASHVRSTSGTSQFSIATSTGSAGTPRNTNGGSFVHPFQQTPRTSTPPLLSYANGRASLDTLNNITTTTTRDSPTTIDENDGELEPFPLPAPGSRPLQNSIHTSSHRRPSLVARGSSSPQQPSESLPRLSTSRRPTRSSDVQQLSATPSVTVVDDSPVAQLPASATATNSPLSPLRSSLDMNNFRIRSRSDVDTSTRQEQVRAARRKFEEKERAKQEKYTREQTRKQHHHHHHHKARKSSLGTRSSTSEQRPPAMPRRSTAHEKSELEASNGLFSHEPEEEEEEEQRQSTATTTTTPVGPTDMNDVRFGPNNRRRDAKRKTTGAWTAFVLWFRTRLLKLGRR